MRSLKGIETNLGGGLGLVVGPRLVGGRDRRGRSLRLGKGRGGRLGAQLAGMLIRRSLSGGRDAVDLGLGNIAVHLLGGCSLLGRSNFGLGGHSLGLIDNIVRGEVGMGNRLDLRNFQAVSNRKAMIRRASG